jgi:protein-serine/threonine kinase
MTVEQLKAHPVSFLFSDCYQANIQFFYGVDWASIRDIDAPFVPHLKSITDTSYFPTDEIDQSAAEVSSGDAGTDARKDLAFLGYT